MGGGCYFALGLVVARVPADTIGSKDAGSGGGGGLERVVCVCVLCLNARVSSVFPFFCLVTIGSFVTNLRG